MNLYKNSESIHVITKSHGFEFGLNRMLTDTGPLARRLGDTRRGRRPGCRCPVLGDRVPPVAHPAAIGTAAGSS